ncbi:Clp protease N-terminal domain-containing protein [Rhodococcus koreensis]
MASEAARAHHHDYLGTGHILLGLVREHDGAAARALELFECRRPSSTAGSPPVTASQPDPGTSRSPGTPNGSSTRRGAALRSELGTGRRGAGRLPARSFPNPPGRRCGAAGDLRRGRAGAAGVRNVPPRLRRCWRGPALAPPVLALAGILLGAVTLGVSLLHACAAR